MKKNNKEDIVDVKEEFIEKMNKSLNVKKEYKKPFTFTADTYKELEKNMALYKENDPDAAAYIISSFNLYLTKIAKFLCYGQLSVYCFNKSGKNTHIIDKSIYRLVNLYIKKPVAPGTKLMAFYNASNLLTSLFRSYSYEDVYNELVCVLLFMASKYQIKKPGDKFYKKNGSFHTYVDRCFHFEAYKALYKLTKDPLNYPWKKHLYYNSISGYIAYQPEESNEELLFNAGYECFIEDDGAQRRFEECIEQTERDLAITNTDQVTMKETDSINPYNDNSLNLNWMNGITCSDVFKDLSPYERELLVLSYQKNMTDEQIATIYSCHRTTINSHKSIAIKKLSKTTGIQRKERKKHGN